MKTIITKIHRYRIESKRDCSANGAIRHFVIIESLRGLQNKRVYPFNTFKQAEKFIDDHLKLFITYQNDAVMEDYDHVERV